MFLLFLGLSCHGSLWKTKRPMTDHLLREDCGYELLYIKQLNREQSERPVGRKTWEGAVEGGWSGRGGPVEIVTEVGYECSISALRVLMDSGQVFAQCINTPRYISHQSLSTCCLLKASVVLRPQSPSGCFQVSPSRTSHTFPDMDMQSSSQ